MKNQDYKASTFGGGGTRKRDEEVVPSLFTAARSERLTLALRVSTTQYRRIASLKMTA
jgi:hypothetical protein